MNFCYNLDHFTYLNCIKGVLVDGKRRMEKWMDLLGGSDVALRMRADGVVQPR